MVRSDHRHAHDLGLDRRAAEGFGVQRGGDGEVAEGVAGGHVMAVADDADVVHQLAGADGPFELGQVAGAALAVAGQDQQEVGDAARLEFGGRLDGQGLALPAGEPAGEQDAGARVGGIEVPCGRQGRLALGRHGGGIEAGDIDAAGNGDDLGRIDPMLGDDMVAG